MTVTQTKAMPLRYRKQSMANRFYGSASLFYAVTTFTKISRRISVQKVKAVAKLNKKKNQSEKYYYIPDISISSQKVHES